MNSSINEDRNSVVVSFRAPAELVKQLDELAMGDQRTRANFIVRTLTNGVSLEPAIAVVAAIVPALLREHQKNPDSPQAEAARGELRGARAVVAAFFGKRAMRWVDDQVRKQKQLPIAHVVPLAEDGNRYGFDSSADIL